MLECGQGQLCADGASLQFLRTSQRLSPQKRASELARAMCEAAYGGGKGQGLLGIYEYEWALAYQESGKSLDGSRRVVDQYWPAILEAEVGPLTVWAGGMVGTDRRRELVRSLLVVHDSLTADWQQRAAKQDTSIRIDPRFDEMTPQKEEAIASSLALMYLRSVLEYLSNPALIQYEEPLFFERACCSPNGDAVDVARAFANGH
jgi:hypothetical protein